MGILAVDIGGTAIKSAIYQDGALTGVGEIPTLAKEGADAMLGRVIALGRGAGPFSAIGVSTASQVDPESGTITSATETFPGYTGMPVGRILEEAFHCPVVVDNDVNCAGFAEGQVGAARDCPDFLCLTYGTGIGMAIVLGGALHYGARFSAGEVGHMKTHGGGLRCNCGGLGCYEAYASTAALVQRVYEATGEVRTGREICGGALLGDEALAHLLDAWVDEVVWGLSSVVHIFNPPCVVLGGGIMESDWVFAETARRLPLTVMPNFQSTSLRRAQLGNAAGMMGAALLAEKLLGRR